MMFTGHIKAAGEWTGRAGVSGERHTCPFGLSVSSNLKRGNRIEAAQTPDYQHLQ
jgi:hypothetical protein